MDKLRIGLLGAGFVQDFHMAAFGDIPEAEVVAVASYNADSTRGFAAKWGIEQSFSGESAIEQLCASKGVDAVLVALPNDLHLRAVKLAAENGKHVICEKPLGRNAGESREMLAAVEKAGVLHAYAENQVFFPLYARTLGLIREGALGDVYQVRSREAHGGPHSKWFWDPDRSGGGVALDMGCHSVEVARKFIDDEPVEVLMWADTLVHDARGEDNCVILVRYKHKQLGQAENSWSAHGGLDLRSEVYATDAVCFLDNTRETGVKIFSTKGLSYVVEKAEETRGWVFPVVDEYRVYGYFHEDKHFTEAFLCDELPAENFADGVVVNEILDAGFRSVESKRWEAVNVH
ncbi:MAG: Gfo/Idh/MocA family protein [Promethearchaeota archaeon]